MAEYSDDVVTLEGHWLSSVLIRRETDKYKPLYYAGSGLIILLVGVGLGSALCFGIGIFFLIGFLLLPFTRYYTVPQVTRIDFKTEDRDQVNDVIHSYLRSSGYRFKRFTDSFMLASGPGYELAETGIVISVVNIWLGVFSLLPIKTALVIRNATWEIRHQAIELQIGLDNALIENGLTGLYETMPPIMYRMDPEEARQQGIDEDFAYVRIHQNDL